MSAGTGAPDVNGLVAFNLLVNGIGAFAIGWVLSRVALRVFRPGPGPARVALVALPFVKLGFELVRGVPADSFLWLRARGVPQDLGSFQMGVGVRWIVPQVHLTLGALSRGALYPQSGADLAAAALAKKVGAWAPSAIAAGLLVVGAVLLGRRAAAWGRAMKERRALGERAALRGHRRVGRRRVAIFVVPGVEGSPFTGGVLRPYVCFPERVWEALSGAERRAAIGHELAHVAEHHLLLTTLAGLLRDVFWFVPFVGRAERRLREACELAADARAVRRGAGAEILASALVRAREVCGDRLGGAGSLRVGAATLAANEISLVGRVERLLQPGPKPRLGFGHPAAAAALTAWVAAAVLFAIAFGNH